MKLGIGKRADILSLICAFAAFPIAIGIAVSCKGVNAATEREDAIILVATGVKDVDVFCSNYATDALDTSKHDAAYRKVALVKVDKCKAGIKATYDTLVATEAANGGNWQCAVAASGPALIDLLGIVNDMGGDIPASYNIAIATVSSALGNCPADAGADGG